MKRRRFLGHCAATGLSAVFCGRSFGRESGEPSLDAGIDATELLIADPHAHPYPLQGSRSFDSSTPTIEIMKTLNMALCAFSAVGDMAYMRGRSGAPFADTKEQLGKIRRMEEEGQVRLALKSADLQAPAASRTAPAGLMAIEGGDALEGKLQNLDVCRAWSRAGDRLHRFRI